MEKQDWSPWGPDWLDAYYAPWPNEVAELMRARLGLSIHEICALVVLVSFRDRAKPDEYVAWAPLTTIAARTGMSKDAAGRAIRNLLRSGILSEEEKPFRGHARRYDLSHLIAWLGAARRGMKEET
jgi:hypothetical protein